MERSEDLKQVRDLRLVRDERDREVGAAAKGRAGDAVLAASQLFAAVCLLRGDPAWAAFLSLTFVGGGAQCLHRFWEDRERFFLICGLAASACGAALVLFLLLLLVFVLIYRTGVPARCMPPEETLNIWGAFF